MLAEQELWALALATFAGLSTTLGAAIAVIRTPDDALLSFLLGTAIGVMLLLSVIEMWLHNAVEHGWVPTTAAFAAGAAVFRVLQPLLAKLSDSEHGHGAGDKTVTPGLQQQGPSSGSSEAVKGGTDRSAVVSTTGARVEKRAAARGSAETGPTTRSRADADASSAGAGVDGLSVANGRNGLAAALATSSRTATGDPPPVSPTVQSSSTAATPVSPDTPAPVGKAAAGARRQSPRELLRLGLVMAATMTLHNLPEGAAVAFSAFTPLGAVMALAIAVHNVPEGLVVAAPVYAATGSRMRAVALAAASGLSEPLGAAVVILVARPALTPARLELMLAGVGGLMAAVCVLELWPEAQRCRAPRRLAAGTVLGAAAMAWTLWIGV